MSYVTIQEIIRANEKAGKHFFDADTLRFFRSRPSEYAFKRAEGYLFTESVAGGFRGTEDGRKRLFRVNLMKEDGCVVRLAQFKTARAMQKAFQSYLSAPDIEAAR